MIICIFDGLLLSNAMYHTTIIEQIHNIDTDSLSGWVQRLN